MRILSNFKYIHCQQDFTKIMIDQIKHGLKLRLFFSRGRFGVSEINPCMLFCIYLCFAHDVHDEEISVMKLHALKIL